jgi:signal transduction histidine kinase
MIRRWLARLGTLRWRLTLFYCGLLALLLAAVGVSVYVRFGDALKSNISSRLHDLAMVMTPPLNMTSKFGDGTAIESIKGNTVLLEYVKNQLLQNESSNGIYIGVLDENGSLVLDNQPMKQPPGVKTIRPQFRPVQERDGAKPGSAKEYETTLEVTVEGLADNEKSSGKVDGIAYVVPILDLSGDDPKRATESRKEAAPLMYLALVAPLDEVDGAMQQIAYILATGLLAALVIALALGLPIARLGLRPLHRMTDTATLIGAGEMSRRVEVPSGRTSSAASVDAGDEVQELARAFNAMLDRLEASFQAQARSEARTRQFAADASHEMRSPLTVLGGYIDVLLMGVKDDPAQTERILAAMQRENNRLGRLVVDLLLLTRMDANGTAWLRMEEQGLKDLVVRAIDNMRMVGGQRSLQVIVGEGAEDVRVRGDGDQLYRMLTNLLDNAIRYTGSHGQIVVTLRRSDYEDGWASISVADDGCGIEPEKLPRIFDRFYRADESRTRQTGNAGLGLAICQSIVRAHGGRIGVESEVGLGTVFTVDLPVISDSQQTLSRVSVNSQPALLH